MSAKLIAAIVAIVVVLGAGLFVGYKIGAPGTPTNTVVVDGGLVEQVLKIAELGTIDYHTAAFEVLQHRSGSSKLAFWADADFDVYLFWQGRVKAGIDLDKSHITVQPAAVPPTAASPTAKGTVVIALPPAKILSAEPDAKDGFRFFINWVSSTGSAPPDSTKSDWANLGPAKLRAAATKNNIEKEAAARAKEILSGYVTALGYKATFVDALPGK